MTDRPHGFAKLLEEIKSWWRTGEFESDEAPEANESEAAPPPEKVTRHVFSPGGLVIVILVAVVAILVVRYDREIVCHVAPDSEMCKAMTARHIQNLMEQMNDVRR